MAIGAVVNWPFARSEQTQVARTRPTDAMPIGPDAIIA
jgi:hypothetical protein